jgi:anaerobic selenocysteine-containing dehydrogenase
VSTGTAYRVCPLCEAVCGLELTLEAGRVVKARGDGAHVLSHGFICPKGAAFPQLVNDPDRLRLPMVRRGADWRAVSWDEAFDAVAHGLRGVVERHGREAVAVYLGNPTVHSLAYGFYISPFLKALATRNRFSAATVDQMPKHVACGYMFGDPLAIPVPDLDRTSFVLLLGANPWESNGSLATAPDFRGRLKDVQARGGRFVVVDPRRTATAAHADRHLAIRPGTDALLLFALTHVLFAEGLVNLGRVEEHVRGVEAVRSLAQDFTPARVAAATGIAAEDIVALARELAAAKAAAVYARIGTCTVEFGTLAQWLVDVLNALTGNLDREGGAMWPLAAHMPAVPAKRRGFVTGRWRTRVRGLPEVLGEMPTAALAEEIDTPGEGQIRSLFTVAGNPARSAPNSERLERALGDLELMVSVDPYLNETTRHAHVILPPTDASRTGHYDFAFTALAVRNHAVYSRPAIAPGPDDLDDCAILSRLAAIASEQAWEYDSSEPERRLDQALRVGAYGLSVEQLLARPHGIDLGPLRPRVPEVLQTPDGRIDLCPEPIAADVARLRATLEHRNGDSLVLIGRRHLRSNNSWMHNLPMLVAGPDRCTLHVHPSDAARVGVSSGQDARVTSRVGSVVVAVEVTDAIAPGVVSLPHGWGHRGPGLRLSTAMEHAGVNSNALTDELVIEPLSGNAVLNGIPVEVEPAPVDGAG